MTERLFTSPEVCRIAGCTYRQLDYWVRVGHVDVVVAADGPGTRRQFNEAGLMQAAIVALAARAQIPPHALNVPNLTVTGTAILAPGLALTLDRPTFTAHILKRTKELLAS